MLKKRYEIQVPAGYLEFGMSRRTYHISAYSPKQAKLMAFMKNIKGTPLDFEGINAMRKMWMRDRKVKVTMKR